MTSCNCYSCINRIRYLEAQVQDLERQLASLRYDLEREVDDRRAAIRAVQEGI